MLISSEDNEIQIIAKKNNLQPEQADFAAQALDSYFASVYDFETAAERIAESAGLSVKIAEQLLLSGAVLYFDRMDAVKQNEILDIMNMLEINAADLMQELLEAEAKIITPQELLTETGDDKTALLEIFRNHFKEVLFSYGEARQMADEALIENLFLEGQAFQEELISALNENRQAIGDNTIIIGGQNVSPTIGNWIKDFENNALADSATGSKKIEYINNSRNFKFLSAEERPVIVKLMDIYRRLKNYQQDFAKIDVGDWHIIPPLENEAELEQKQKLEDLQAKYKDDLSYILQKYKVTENCAAYQKMEAEQILEAINKHLEDPSAVLPALDVLAGKDQAFKMLEQSVIAKRINKGEFWITTIKQSKNYSLLRKLLSLCELSTDESAMFAVHLASKNKNLQGLAYADLKDGAFKWR